ncbi:MAG TPA: TonB-dependent receptor, partial [Bacteroidia bacterium]|nr:TonB-dependent receptor [Bacteroidia bacterium]
MKSVITIISTMLLFVNVAISQSVTGTVVDSSGGQGIPGAIVYFPELKLGTTTDAQGNFKMTSMPNGTYEMEVKILGYATLTQQVSIKDNETCTCNCKMGTSCCSANEVVITALGNITNSQRSPEPVTLVTHDMLLQNSSSTIIDAISTQPGVNMTTEGPGTTKPQINGLGFDRVLVLTDGLRQEDFQWGDDHGILIDPYSIYDAEIIRGPASLQYGASAEAGVINFKTQPFAENGTVQGSVLTEYQTNNGYIGNSENIGGNNNGFVWNLRVSSEETHAYWNPKDGYVWGTAWQQENARLTLGLNKSWGYTRLSFSALHRRIQVPGGNRDSSGRFEFKVPQNGQIYPTMSNFLSYDPSIAGDKILDEYQAWWQNSINVGTGRIGFDIGFTESKHYDIDTGTIGRTNFAVCDIPYSLKYQLAGENTGLKFTTGVNGTYEFENNIDPPPAPYISNYQIPNYT